MGRAVGSIFDIFFAAIGSLTDLQNLKTRICVLTNQSKHAVLLDQSQTKPKAVETGLFQEMSRTVFTSSSDWFILLS